MINEYKIKSVDELTFTDDFMFGTIMREAPLCHDVLECLLQMKIDKIEYPKLQESISPFYEAKGVRLDVYVQDGTHAFDVEMQTTLHSAIGRRTRYYQSMIDIENLEKGADYAELKDSYVIFICTKDPFGAELPQYSFRNVCEEDKTVDLNDGTYKLLFNAEGYRSAKTERLQAFLHYLKTQEPTDTLTARLNKSVLKARINDKFRSDYMQYTLHERDVRMEGYNKGVAYGQSEQSIKDATNFLLHNTPVKLISECIGLSIEEVESLAARLKKEGKME